MSKRYDFIDLLKCIAIFMAISLHTGLWSINFMENTNIAVKIQYCIRVICEGVPIFVLVNGFLLIHKDFDLEKHLKKCLHIFVVLLFWSVVSVVVILIFNNGEFSFSNIINQVLDTNVSNYYDGHLWFLQNLLSLYIVFPLLKMTYDKNKKLYKYFFIIVVVLAFLPNMLGLFNDLFKCNQLVKISDYINRLNPFCDNHFIAYFMVGGYLYDKKECLKMTSNRKKILIISFISYFVIIFVSYVLFKIKNINFSPNYFYGSILLLFVIIGIVMITGKYDPKKENLLKKLINSVGMNTLGIYLVHFMLVKTTIDYFDILNCDFSVRFLYTIIIIIISYTITCIIKKIPLLKKSVEI